MSMRFVMGCCAMLTLACCGSDSMQARYVGGQVTGLTQGSLILGATDGQSIAVTKDAAFTLPRPIAQGASYDVYVLSAPTGQSCTVAHGTGVIGTQDVTDVSIACDLAFGYYTVGGLVTGLSASQASGLVLSQGQERLGIAADGAFTFKTPLADLAPYAVGIAAVPVGQDCQIQSAQGYVDAGHVQDVHVACQPSQAITLSIAVSGLVQDPNAHTDTLQIIDAGAQPAPLLTFSTTTPQAQRFVKSYTYGAPYAVRLLAPAGMRCTWDASGRPYDPTTIQGVLVGNVTLEVSCVPEVTYTLSVEVGGITRGVALVSNHQSTDVNNPMAFDLAQIAPKAFGYGYTPQQAYSVAIASPPGQSCAPTSQSPGLTGLMQADTTVSLVCTPSPARLSVSASGVTRGSVQVSSTRPSDANNPLTFTPSNPNAVQYFAHTFTAGDTASLSLSASQLACYFVANGATRLDQTLLGDTFVAIACAQTIP